MENDKLVRASDIFPALQSAGVPYNYATQRVIEQLPAVDAVEVVRCRECRYSREPNRAFRDEAVACEGVLVCYVGFDHVHPTSDDGMIFVDADGFCDQGQCREDGDA